MGVDYAYYSYTCTLWYLSAGTDGAGLRCTNTIHALHHRWMNRLINRGVVRMLDDVT